MKGLKVIIQLNDKKLAEITVTDKINSCLDSTDGLTIQHLTLSLKALSSAAEAFYGFPMTGRIGIVNTDEFDKT